MNAISPQGRRVLGVVVQLNTAGHLTAVAGYADGNLRFSNDSGLALLGLKASFPKEAQDAAAQLPHVAQKVLSKVPLAGDCAAPGNDEVKFALLTPAGIHAKTAPYRGLQASSHPLHELWTASDRLIETSYELIKKRKR